MGKGASSWNFRYIKMLPTEKLIQIKNDNYRYWLKRGGKIRDLYDYKQEIDNLISKRRIAEHEGRIGENEALELKRVDYLLDMFKTACSDKFKPVRAECIMLVYLEFYKLGYSDQDIVELF